MLCISCDFRCLLGSTSDKYIRRACSTTQKLVRVFITSQFPMRVEEGGATVGRGMAMCDRRGKGYATRSGEIV